MNRMMSWDALRVFVAVQRAGSFSAAADELGLAQSSASEQVARLERNIGYQLFDRGPSGVRPTDRGLELFARVTAPVDALSAVTEAGGLPEKCGPRTVFLGGPAEFLSEVVLPGLPDRLPDGIRVVARFGLADELIADLRAGAVDVLVSALPARGPDLTSVPIYDEEFALVGHPDRRPNDLDTRIIAPDLRSLLRLTVEGAGMSVLPDYLIRDHLRTGALVEQHEPALSPLNTLYVATRKPVNVPDPTLTAVREAVTSAARAAAE